MEHSAVFASYTTKPWEPAQYDNPESIVRGLAPHLWKAALKMRRPDNFEVEDLLQCALLAALECVATFDPTLGPSFGAYALTVGRRAMFNACAEGQGIMRIPASSRTRQTDEVQASIYAQHGAVRLDAPVEFDGGDGYAHEGFIGGPTAAVGVDDMLAMKQVIDRLPARAQASLELRALGEPVRGSASVQAESSSEQGAVGRVVTGLKSKRKPKSNCYPGVSFHKESGKWQARRYLRHCGKRKQQYVGKFATEAEAARALGIDVV